MAGTQTKPASPDKAATAGADDGSKQQQQQFTAINPAAFKGGFSEATLLAYLARDVLKERGARSHLEGSAQAVARASLDKVQMLLGTLDK